MLYSTAALLKKVSGPVGHALGSKAKILTVELHGDEVRGLVSCPGKIVRYVLHAQTKRFHTAVLMKIASKSGCL